MKLIDVHKQFASEEACLDYLEQMRWPSGLGCLKCGSVKVSRINPKDKRGKTRRIYQCLERPCLHQFTATTGTIFHDTHLPLQKWFLAIALICEAKKGVSACQMQRHLGVNYRTAWYLCHRIREAMKDSDFELAGHVEADETYVGGKVRRRGKPYVKKSEKDVVLGMIERGGKLQLFPIPDATRATMQPILERRLSKNVTVIYTDEHPIYDWSLRDRFTGRHQTINHTRAYALGQVHTNTIENAFSLLKRSITGSFHKLSIKHLRRYCDEFSYRFNRRDEQEQLFDGTLKNILNEKALSYKTLTA